MNASLVETLANRGDLATADFQIGATLRFGVIPEFLTDVARVGWRKRTVSLTLPQGAREVALPRDFGDMGGIWIPPIQDPSDPGLIYFGESDVEVANAEETTDPGAPAGYYLPMASSGDLSHRAVRVDRPADRNYSLRSVYFWKIPFENDQDDSIDLDLYIPSQYQWALVDLLRAKIIDDRYSEGDPRYQAAMDSYNKWVSKVLVTRELARRNHVIYVD